MSGPGAGDPLTPLLALPGVDEALTSARRAVDELLWDRAVAADSGRVAAESQLQGAWANAWFEGAECGLPELRSGAAMDGSPIGRLLASTVVLHAELASQVPVLGVAPAQALARMHALVARGFVPDDDLGRPRATDAPDDALRIGPAPGPPEVAERLVALSSILRSSTAPGVLAAAVAHAEVAALRPFTWGSGLVARALLRVVLAQRGVDPGLLTAPEVGLRAVGRPRYVRALRAYQEGSPEGVAGFVTLVAGAIGTGARSARGWVGDR